MEVIKNLRKTLTTTTAMKMSTAEVKAIVMMRTTMIPSTLAVKGTQMITFLLLSMMRKKFRGQLRHAKEDQ